ncbi:MAG: insulinase family protein [Deltaproteobacteria bacterium]|nr:insulinase family protein [Deltaproteobacteria bacterium]
MYRKSVLENGVRIVSEKLDHLRSVSLGIWVGTGSRDEAEGENGITHFIEHMVFKGTQSRDTLQIAKELDAIGGLSNAFTGSEYTCFYSKVLDKHLDRLAEILSDIFLNATFDPLEMSREKHVILQEINMVEDTPDEYILVLFNRLFWGTHPIGMPVLGSRETVSALDRSHLIEYKKKFYTPERVLIAAAGRVDHDKLVSLLRPFFEDLEPGTSKPERSVPGRHAGIQCHYKELEQVQVCLGGKAPHLSSEQRFAAAILNTMLGGNMSSRLFQEIREKRGLAYSVYSFLSAYVDAGLLGVSFATEANAVNRALGVIAGEVRKIQNGEISKFDLDATKEHLEGGVLLNSENTDSRMTRLAKNEFIFGKYVSYEDVLASLERVTLDDVVEVARSSFNTDKVSLTTLGPFKKDDLDLDCPRFNEPF